MPRCPSCERFVPVELAEPEEESLEVTLDDQDRSRGAVTLEVRLVKACADCGEELEEAPVALEKGFTLAHADGCGGVAEVEASAELQPASRVEGKGRGARTYYGVDANVLVACTKCKAKAEVEMFGEEQASAFEPLF
mgnify:CR=1 FL=1